MTKKKHVFVKLTEELYEITGYFWQVGAVISVLFGLGGFLSLNWAFKQHSNLLTSPQLQALPDMFLWLFYFPSILLLILSAAYAIKAIESWTNE